MGPTAIPHFFENFWFTRICICHAQAIVIKDNMILGFHLMVNMPNGLTILLFQYLSLQRANFPQLSTPWTWAMPGMIIMVLAYKCHGQLYCAHPHLQVAPRPKPRWTAPRSKPLSLKTSLLRSPHLIGTLTSSRTLTLSMMLFFPSYQLTVEFNVKVPRSPTFLRRLGP